MSLIMFLIQLFLFPIFAVITIFIFLNVFLVEGVWQSLGILEVFIFTVATVWCLYGMVEYFIKCEKVRK